MYACGKRARRRSRRNTGTRRGLTSNKEKIFPSRKEEGETGCRGWLRAAAAPRAHATQPRRNNKNRKRAEVRGIFSRACASIQTDARPLALFLTYTRAQIYVRSCILSPIRGDSRLESNPSVARRRCAKSRIKSSHRAGCKAVTSCVVERAFNSPMGV